MSAETFVYENNDSKAPACGDLLQIGFEDLQAFSQSIRPLRNALNNIQQLADETSAKSAIKLRRQLDSLEPSVTMIGQIKSGKTSLVNAMIGWPNLLPADVNPWTSVVTSLHLNPTPAPHDTTARFRFFDQSEWDRLVSGGGRIGELANRAGAQDELETIKQQIAQMREKSMARLGRKFEMLLGQEHNYDRFDQELIERYVCLGDDFDDDDDEPVSQLQGRFADITKSADLYIHRPEFPMRLCLRDTPGVNDTFMMREQITIQSIRESRLCVVVLSAHQALSSTDLALIRLIANIKSREVIIFVNRIDELSDPKLQVPQIRASILETLKQHKGPDDPHVVFGSALWANFAISGRLSHLPEDSADALYNWATAGELPISKESDPIEILWDLSGLPALHRAISERIIEGPAKECVDRIATGAINLMNGVVAKEQIETQDEAGDVAFKMDRKTILCELEAIETQNLVALDKAFDNVLSGFSARVDRALQNFLERATASLVTHLEQYGEHSVWQYDPAGLRVLLSSSYRSFGNQSQKAFRTCADTATADFTDLCQRALNISPGLFSIKAPPTPRIPPPVTLGRTIALDLKGNWWKSWWFRRRGYQAFTNNFYDLIKAETEIFVTDLKGDQAAGVREDYLDQFAVFLAEQSAILKRAISHDSRCPDKIDEALGLGRKRARDAVLRKTLTILEGYAKC